MPDDRLARRLAGWLPADAAADWFAPAALDLRNARDEGTPGYRLHLVLLFLDCWRLVIQDALRDLLRLRPPREPLVMIFYQLRHAFRRLLREPGFTLAAVLTLTLGVGANVAVFAVVEAVLLRPLPYQEPDQLVIMRHRNQLTGITKEFIAVGDYVDIAARQTSFQALGGYGTFQATIYGEDEPFQVPTLMATSGALDALRFRPFLGRGFRPEDNVTGAGQVAILGYQLWQTRFDGDSAIVGRSIKVGSETIPVIGVAPPGFRFPPSTNSGLIISQTTPAQAPTVRQSGWTFAVGRLEPGATPATATAELATVSSQLATEYPASNRGTTYYALSLRDSVVGSTRTALLLLLGVVGAVLLIACANVANLLLARSLGRSREMAVRMTLGAGRGRLIGQLLTESFALTAVGGAIGIALAHWGSRLLVRLVPESAAAPGLIEVGVNPMVLGFAVVIVALTALGCGLVSALSTPVARTASHLVVAGRGTMPRAARRATSGLVVAEISFALILLIGAGLILKSFAGLVSVDPGFRIDGTYVTQVSVPADRYREVPAREAFYRQAFEGIRAIPGVNDVGVAAVVPLTGNNWTAPFERADQPVPPGERPPEVGWQVASGGYFTAMKIPLLEGRLFDRTDRPESPPVAIISEATRKRFFPAEPAIGKQIRVGPQLLEIVGVVGDIRRAGLDDEPRADLYFPFERNPGLGMNLFIRTEGDPAALAGPVRAALRAIEPNAILVNSRTMADIASESIRVTRLVLWLLGIFAAVALALAAVGIYGVMSYLVRQRTREIGTRLALGAGRTDIVWMVMRQGAVIAGLGVAIGLATGLAATRALRSLLFGVSGVDLAVLAVAVAILGLTALVACWVPARRAAAVDPAKTLAEL